MAYFRVSKAYVLYNKEFEVAVSPPLFNLYLDNATRQWGQGIYLTYHRVSISLFSDDQVLLDKSENELQHSLHNLNMIIQNYNL
jgi:hypothetical protein